MPEYGYDMGRWWFAERRHRHRRIVSAHAASLEAAGDDSQEDTVDGNIPLRWLVCVPHFLRRHTENKNVMKRKSRGKEG